MDKKNDGTYDANKEIEKTHNAIYEIYSRIHHTNVEGQKNTDTRLNDALNYYYRKNELLD